MPRYIVAITRRQEFIVDAPSSDEAVDNLWLGDPDTPPARDDLSISLLRRDPPLFLPVATIRTYKIEYRHGGRLVFEHVTKRLSALDARAHSRRVELMLHEMQKSVDEVRVRELSPEPMLGRSNGYEA